MIAVLQGLFGALIGGVAGALLFFLVTTTLLFGNNLGGLVGLMVVPVGLIVGAIFGAIVAVKRLSPKSPQTHDEGQDARENG